MELLLLNRDGKSTRCNRAGAGGSGPYWVYEKDLPVSVSDVIGGTAVRPEWNNFKILYEYEVPLNTTIKGWAGNAAPQKVSNGIDGYHLPGGTEQLYIPYINQQDANFEIIVNKTSTGW